MAGKENVYRFLSKEEIMEIINLIKEVDSDDVKCRFYLLTLGYKSVDIQNFTIEEAKDMVNNNTLPEYMLTAFKNSLNARLKSIEEKGLIEDIDYLFVNANDKHIHDCYALRDWRRFLKANDLGDISMHVYRQSINYLLLNEKYQKNIENEYEMEV